MSEIDEIKELFQKKLGNHKVKVDPSLWTGVQAGISAGASAPATSISLFGKIAIGIGTASIIVAGAIMLNNSTPEKENQLSENKEVKEETLTKETIQEKQNRKQPISFNTQSNTQNEKVVTSQHSTAKENSEHKIEENEIIAQQQNIEEVELNKENVTYLENNQIKTNNNEEVVVSQNTIEETNKENQNSQKVTSSPIDLSTVTIETDKVNNQHINFTALGVPNDANVFWKFGDGRVGYTTKQEHFYEKSGNYTVELIVKKGTDKRVIEKEIAIKIKGKITQLPNTFTPNGDGYNDLFFVDAKQIATFQITIMDEHRKVVYTSNNPNFKWNGINQFGRQAKEGKYFYIIVAEDEQGNIINKYQQLIIQR